MQCNSAKHSDGLWSLHSYNQYVVVSGTVISGLDCSSKPGLILLAHVSRSSCYVVIFRWLGTSCPADIQELDNLYVNTSAGYNFWNKCVKNLHPGRCILQTLTRSSFSGQTWEICVLVHGTLGFMPSPAPACRLKGPMQLRFVCCSPVPTLAAPHGNGWTWPMLNSCHFECHVWTGYCLVT